MRQQQSGYYWWFGINNIKDRRNKKFNHVIYPEIEQFLKGYVDNFEWPRNKRNHRLLYETMRESDSVLFWMGDGYFLNWEIIGFAYIDKIIKKGDTAKYKLKRINMPEKTIKPYENGKPRRTEITDFLVETFSMDFGPLYKNFIQIDEYRGQKISTAPIAITIEEISKQQFEKCFEFTEKLNNQF